MALHTPDRSVVGNLPVDLNIKFAVFLVYCSRLFESFDFIGWSSLIEPLIEATLSLILTHNKLHTLEYVN